jgi:hypothetical protein
MSDPRPRVLIVDRPRRRQAVGVQLPALSCQLNAKCFEKNRDTVPFQGLSIISPTALRDAAALRRLLRANGKALNGKNL